MPRFWKAEPRWKDETVFIVASGPSLESITDADFKNIEGRKVITVNTSFRRYPGADIYFFADSRWWRWYGSEIPLESPTRIVSTCKMGDAFRDPRILRMNRDYRYDPKNVDNLDGKTRPLSDDPTALSGPDSGYMAINLAYLLGASRIVLLGYDMGFVDGRAHWHEDHPIETPATNYEKLFLPRYPALVDTLVERGVSVLRCTPSKLDFIREIPFAEAAALPDRQRGRQGLPE